MNKFTTFRVKLKELEQELLRRLELDQVKELPPQLDLPLQKWLPDVCKWCSTTAQVPVVVVADEAVAPGTGGAPAAAAELVQPEGKPQVPQVQSEAASEVKSQPDEAEDAPAAKKQKVRKEKSVRPKIAEIVDDINLHFAGRPSPGCRRPYGSGHGCCNSKKQKTCFRPDSCECWKKPPSTLSLTTYEVPPPLPPSLPSLPLRRLWPSTCAQRRLGTSHRATARKKHSRPGCLPSKRKLRTRPTPRRCARAPCMHSSRVEDCN